MYRSTRLTRIASLGAAAALALAVAAPVAAADAAKLTAVVAVDSTDTPEAGKAWVRVLHASPDAPAVDVKVNDADVLTDVAFATISDYLPIDAGTYNIKVCAAGTDTCVIDADLTFADGTRTTVAATNLLADIEAQVLVDGAAPVADQAQVRVVHFSADTPAVDVLTQDGATKVVTDLSYPDATDYLALPAGSYDLKVCANADNSVCPLDPGALDLAAGTAYIGLRRRLARCDRCRRVRRWRCRPDPACYGHARLDRRRSDVIDPRVPRPGRPRGRLRRWTPPRRGAHAPLASPSSRAASRLLPGRRSAPSDAGPGLPGPASSCRSVSDTGSRQIPRGRARIPPRSSSWTVGDARSCETGVSG